MPKKTKTEENPEFDFTNLPEENVMTHDPTDVLTHHWVQVGDWYTVAGMEGEFRVLKCDGPDCEYLTTIVDTRTPDPDDPIPVGDPLDVPQHNADYDGT